MEHKQNTWPIEKNLTSRYILLFAGNQVERKKLRRTLGSLRKIAEEMVTKTHELEDLIEELKITNTDSQSVKEKINLAAESVGLKPV